MSSPEEETVFIPAVTKVILHVILIIKSTRISITYNRHSTETHALILKYLLVYIPRFSFKGLQKIDGKRVKKGYTCTLQGKNVASCESVLHM